MDPPRARTEGRDETAEEHICRLEGRKCVCVCVHVCIHVWIEVRVGVHVCAYPHVNASTLACRCAMWVCECMCTSRGESTTRDLRSHATLQHLAADGRAAANKWARSAGRPPPNPLRERLSFWTQASNLPCFILSCVADSFTSAAQHSWQLETKLFRRASLFSCCVKEKTRKKKLVFVSFFIAFLIFVVFYFLL